MLSLRHTYGSTNFFEQIQIHTSSWGTHVKVLSIKHSHYIFLQPNIHVLIGEWIPSRAYYTGEEKVASQPLKICFLVF
jgi:hypothetical protein